MVGGIAELSPEQLQNLRKDQLAALLSAFVKGHSDSSAGGASPGDARPTWELDNFSSRPEEAGATLDFLVWKDQVERWLRDHAERSESLKLARVRGALKGEASHEFSRLASGVVSDKELQTCEGLLAALESAYVPEDTREKAVQRLQRWTYSRSDIIGSAKVFLDDLRLAGVCPDLEGQVWGDVFLAGFPLDFQERMTRFGKGSVSYYYRRLREIVSEQTYRKERCRLPPDEASLTVEQVGGAVKSINQQSRRSLEGQASRSQHNDFQRRNKGESAARDPSHRTTWCRYHGSSSHNTHDCTLLNKDAARLGRSAALLVRDAERRRAAGSSRTSANFRPSTGTA